MSKLPVSVVVPYSRNRKDFFEGFVLPMIEANNPEEIIVIDQEGSAGHKRNKGAKQAKGKYILFCDDDVVLKKGALQTHLSTLEAHRGAAFSYSNFAIINLHPGCAPQFKNTLINSLPWDVDRLKQDNYIDTCALIRKSEFPGFDEELPSLEDWDLWLTMAEAGSFGVHIDKLLFLSFHIDVSLSYRVSVEHAKRLVHAKHGIS